MGSFTFNGIDLTAYGLKVLKLNVPAEHSSSYVQLPSRSYADDSQFPPKVISLEVAVQGAGRATLDGYLDSIKRVLNQTTDKSLKLDAYTDRYWNARHKSLIGDYASLNVWLGAVEFVCYDPCAYDNTLTDANYTDNEEPEIITITPGGSALIEPVFILTSSVVDATADIRVRNETLGMELEWTGDIGIGDQLKIDSPIWHVTLNDVASMTIEGQFPVLSPGIANVFEIYGFTGNVNVTYRNRFI